jgi:hypothetical protein
VETFISPLQRLRDEMEAATSACTFLDHAAISPLPAGCGMRWFATWMTAG